MTDRRSFITGLALAPVIVAAPAIAAAPTSAKAHWDMMMARRNEAERAHLQFNQRHDHVFKEAYKLFPNKNGPTSRQPGYAEWTGRAHYEAVGQRSDDLCNAFVDADFAMIETEAPDLAALRWKIEKAFEEEGELAQHFKDLILKDARRLLA